tara:strand:+ start:4231 stop:4644 length:414 start_codon:yes stop_codon:yes gene_type:complete
MNNTYDFFVIDAGISGCTFTSSLNKVLPHSSILLIEQGKRLGGRATTRNSRKNLTLEFDHGLPSISLSKKVSEDLLTLISPLIKSKELIDITKDILTINEFSEIYHPFVTENFFRSFSSMTYFCNAIINQSINPKKN